MWIWFLIGGLVFSVVWLGWRYIRLYRDIGVLIHQVRSNQELSELPHKLGELASLINARFLNFNLLLSESEKERIRLATILEQLTDAVLIVDANGRVQFANPAAEKFFGSPLAGRSLVEVTRHYQIVEAWRRCQKTGEVQTESIEVTTSRRFLQLIVVPDRSASDGSLLLVQDLTRMRHLETVRRDFISNISHELRTPLASLKALTETLRDGALSDPSAAPHFLSRIETEVDVLSQMTQELLDLSRIESGQMTLNLSRLNPVQLLNAAAERMRAQAERAGLVLTVEAPATLLEVRADGARVEQVLVNLIHNAVKFTPTPGVITLSAQADRSFVRFTVKDTGIGIPEEDLERVFERFYKTDRSRSGSGTGLGLSISRHIVELHGGKIWVESREGEGSSFQFTLPVAR